MTDEEYDVVLDNTAKEIAAQQKWCDDQKAAFERVLQTRRDLEECRQHLAEARAALREVDEWVLVDLNWPANARAIVWHDKYDSALKEAWRDKM